MRAEGDMEFAAARSERNLHRVASAPTRCDLVMFYAQTSAKLRQAPTTNRLPVAPQQGYIVQMLLTLVS